MKKSGLKKIWNTWITQIAQTSEENSNEVALRREASKEKARWARIKRVYGIGPDEYALLDTGKCPICLNTWSDSHRPCIDHDHSSGKIRGLLCVYCNRYRVGHFRDADLVDRIAKYLRDATLYPEWVVPKKKRKSKRKKK